MISAIFGCIGNLKEVTLKEGTSVGQLLIDRGWKLQDGDEIRVNWKPVDVSYVVQQDDIIFIAFPIRGEVTIRRKGVWRIHKYDADTNWPSDFHAHNVDAPAEVLDLYTGNVFDKRSRRLIRRLRSRDLEFIRSQF
jgi:hypothetical protein